MSITPLLETFSRGDGLTAVLLMLKITAILLAALAVTVALHRAAASTRHLVWLVSLAGLLALPAIARTIPMGLEILPANAATIVTAPGLGTDNSGVRTDSRSEAEVVNNGIVVSARQNTAPVTTPWWRTVPITTLLLSVWGVVTLFLVARLLHGVWAVRRIVRRARSLDDGAWRESMFEIADRLQLDDVPALLQSGDIHMPFAAGLFRPVIVLPTACEQWSSDQREAVLIHELGHVSRRDIVGHTLGRLTCAVYWFHPLVWTAARRLRDASERACDDLAIRLGARPSDYAQHLLDIVTTVRHPYTPTAAIAMARRKEFEGRMLAILDPSLPRNSAPRWRTVSLSVVLTAFVVAVSAAAPISRNALPSPSDSNHAAIGQDPAQQHPVAAPVAATKAKEAESPTPIADLGDAGSLPRANGLARGVDNVVGAVSRELSRAVQHYGSDLAGLFADSSVNSPERMDRLITILRDDASGKVRRVAAWGLERYADQSAAQSALIRALSSDDDAGVRTMAAWAMTQNPGPATLTALRTAASNDDSDEVREMALWGLGSNSDASAAAVITSQLTTSKSEKVRYTAAWALGQVGTSTAPPALIAMLQDDRARNRTVAAWALSEIGDSKTLPAISRALEQPQEANTTRALVRALRRTGGDADQLLPFLTSLNEEAKLAAVRALSGASSIDPWPWPWPRPIPFP